MEEAINRLSETIQLSNGNWDWASAISALCSLISLIAIIILLIERLERKRPYMQVSFQLLRDSLVCLVFKNVGEVPLTLKSVQYDEDFMKQVPKTASSDFFNKENANITIFPTQQWVVSLRDSTPNVTKYNNTVLHIKYTYSSKSKKKLYSENTTIDFKDYGGYIVYISEQDEIKKEIKLLAKNTKKLSDKINDSVNLLHYLLQKEKEND